MSATSSAITLRTALAAAGSTSKTASQSRSRELDDGVDGVAEQQRALVRTASDTT